MGTISSAAELKLTIQQLEFKHALQGQILKEHFLVTVDQFTPVNLIKKALNDITTSPYLIENILGSGMGLVVGYLTKKMAVGSSNNLFRKLIGFMLQFGVTNVVAQHPEIFRSVGQFIMEYLQPKRGDNI